MDELLRKLAERLRTYDSEVLTADEVAVWPEGRLAELESQGLLTEIQHADDLVCNQCEENCYIEPAIRTNPTTDKAVGIFVCTCNPDVGRMEIDLNRMRRWRINKKKLWKLVYGFDSEWQVPWDDDNSEYITLQEAVNLVNDDSITIRKVSRLLEDADFPAHRMHKGRRCKVHLDEFRKWLRFAQHGQVTDEVIEKYLEAVKERKEKALHIKERKNKSQ